MTSFEFLLGMYSIILGLGISRLLEGIKNLVVSARPVRGTGLYIWMLVIGLLVHVTTWLSLWGLRHVETWSVWSFLLVMLVPVLMYLYSSITVPDNDRSVDLGEYYLSNAGKMHGLLISAIVINGFAEFVILERPSSIPLAAMRIAIASLLLVCALMPRAIHVHRVILPAVMVGAATLVLAVDFQIR